MLDASALVMVGVEGAPGRQAQLTFAMARHAVVDLAMVTGARPSAPDPDRLAPEDFHSLRASLAQDGVVLKDGAVAERAPGPPPGLYEPSVTGLGAPPR